MAVLTHSATGYIGIYSGLSSKLPIAYITSQVQWKSCMYAQRIPAACLIFTLVVYLPTPGAEAQLDQELSSAMALTPDIETGKVLYTQLCAECHGEDGWGSTGGEYPQLAGQHRSVIIKQLADIRAGNRDNPKMFPIVEESRIGSAQAIADIAAYISTLLMDSFPAAGDGIDLARAEEIYLHNCSRCHGANGEGHSGLHYPLIQGQHFEYLLRQLQWIRDGQRKNANPQMAALIRQMKDGELALLADYISRMEPPAEKLSDK